MLTGKAEGKVGRDNALQWGIPPGGTCCQNTFFTKIQIKILVTLLLRPTYIFNVFLCHGNGGH